MVEIYIASNKRTIFNSVSISKRILQLFLMISLFCFAAIHSANAQTYINGNLSTGTLNAAAVPSPAGSNWSEIQTGNSLLGTNASANSFRVADDFTVCSNWNVTKFIFYAYISDPTVSTSPFNFVSVAVYNTDPSVGSPTPVFGDMTSTYFFTSYAANLYRVGNALSDLSRQVWKIEATVPSWNLAPGHYWVSYSLGNNTGLGLPSFVPISTVLNTITQPGNNAKSRNSAGVWSNITDGTSLTNQDIPFIINYTTAACSGAPTPGNTLTTNAGPICPSVDFTLSLTNPDCQTGITYQWQYYNGSAWVPIAGATASNLTTNFAAALIPSTLTSVQFRAAVTCANGGSTGNSNPITVGQNSFSNCYCIPGTTICTALDDILNVTIGGINNSTTGCVNNGYSDYTSTVAAGNVVSGVSNPMSVTVNHGGTEYVGVWIDYNHDGIFGTNEFTLLGTGASFSTNILINGNIAIPTNALPGLTRMRVRTKYAVALNGSDGCTAYTYGQTEDYFVTITPATSCNNSIGLGATQSTETTVCPTINFTLSAPGVASYSGITYLWYTSPTGLAGSYVSTGITTSSYTTTLTASTYYQAQIFCSGTPVGYTGAAQVLLTPPSNCYCTSAANYTGDEEILNVTFGSMNNSSTCATVAPGPGSIQNRYSNYTTTVAAPNVFAGIDNAFSVQVGECLNFNYTNSLAIWIDYNEDGVFDNATERVYTSASAYGASTFTGNINIPGSTSPGTKRMRVISDETGTSTNIPSCGTYNWGETEDYLVNVISATPCTGSISLPGTVSSVSTICPNVNFNLSLSAGLPYNGITFQWLYSSTGAGGPYNPVPNGGTPSTSGTQSSFTTSLTQSTYYSVAVYCNGGLVNNTVPVQVTLAPPTDCYCTSGASSTADEDIYNITLGSFSNTSTCASVGPGVGSIQNEYSNYTTLTPVQIFAGTSTAFSVQVGTCGGIYPNAVAAWIDYNGDGIFDNTTEKVYFSPACTTGPHTESGFIDVPITANGIHRMRIVCMEFFNVTCTPETISPCGTYSWGETEDYLVNIQTATACNNTYSPGNTISSANPICPSVPFTLSFSNASPVSGLSYQWQSSTDGGVTWNNIAGATDITFVTTQLVITKYRILVNCVNSAQPSYSIVLNESMSLASACYCVPPSSVCSTVSLTNVNFGGINNTSTCSASGYINYTGAVAAGVAFKGSTNPINLTISSTGSRYAAVWIDYNRNGAFETNEYTYLGVTTTSTLSGTIVIPTSATNGQTLMRVRVCTNSGLIGSGNACTGITTGETEDYQVNILSCTTVSFESVPVPTTVACGNNASFIVQVSTTGTPIYQWQVRTSAGGSWSFVVNGTNYGGATTNVLAIISAPLNFNGYEYRAVVNGNCTIADTSASAKLTVTPSGTTTFTTQPANQTVNCGGNASFSFAVSTGTFPVYQWQVRLNSSSNWINLTNGTAGGITVNGAQTINLLLSGLTNSLNGYQYRAYVSSSCSPSDTSAFATLTVNAINLGISVVSNASANTVCNGSPVTFTATPSYSGTQPLAIKWYIDNIATANATSVTNTIYVGNTAQLVVGMVVSVFSGTGTFFSNTTITSIINATSFTVSAAPFIAIQNGAVLSVTIPGVNGLTYTTSNLSNGNIIRIQLGVNDPSLCTTPNPSFSAPLTMTVTNNVATTVTLNTANTVVCANTNIAFTTNAVNTGANPAYQFLIGSTLVQTGSSNTYSINTNTITSGQYVKVIMISTANNCPFPNPASDSLLITVNPAYPVSVTLAANPGGSGPGISICNNTSVVFTATGVNPGPTPTYVFRKNTIPVQSSSSNTYTTTTLVNSDVIDCILTSGGLPSCVTGNGAVSNSLTVSITTQIASVTLACNSVSVCAGAPATYTATPTNGGASPSYHFYVNGITVGSIGASYTYIPGPNDTITVAMTSSLGCAIPSPAYAGIRQTLVDRPTATIGLSTLTCSANSATLDAGASAGAGTISGYQWQSSTSSINGPYTNISGATSSTYFAGNAGTTYYNVIVTNTPGGCSFTSNGYNLTLPIALAAMQGTYTIGAVTATASAANASTTINVSSTANLTLGALVTVTSGTGVFAANTIITSIGAGSFTVNIAPTTNLIAGDLIAGATCTNYINFKTAFADLNSRAITNIGCIFNVTAAYQENLTARLDLGSTALNASLSGRSIVFQKSGSGVNPQINAYTGTGTSVTNPDGMVALSGVNNVTFDGINLNDGNTSSITTMMEYGYGLFRLINTDGAQNNTIKYCKISLNKSNSQAAGTVLPEGSIGILAANSVSTAANTAFTNGGTVGANSNNKIYNDSIVNCNYGIAFTGFTATGGGVSPVDGDFGNDIGGATTATGNSILNFGGATSATLGAAGVLANNQWGMNISNNIINNNNGLGVNHANVLRGIYGKAGVGANVTINNNAITIAGGGTTTSCAGIDNLIGTTGAGNTVNINNNTVAGNYSTSTTGYFYAVYNAAVCTNLNMNGNTVQNSSFATVAIPSTGEWRGVYNGGTPIQNVSMNNNTVSNNNISSSSTAGSAIYTAVVNAVANNSTVSVSGNNVIGNTRTASVTTASAMNLLYIAGCAGTSNINNNVLTDNTINLTSGATANAFTLYCIYRAADSTSNINNNTIRNNGININATGSTGAMVNDGIITAGNSVSETITGNVIRRLYVSTGNATASTGAHVIYGINSTGSITRGIKSINSNQADTLYTYPTYNGKIYAIANQFGASLSIAKNKISSLWPGQSATANISTAVGIWMRSSSATTGVNNSASINNNMVALNYSGSTGTTGAAVGVINSTIDGLRGIDLASTTTNSTLKVYNNSIRLTGTGVALFSASGIYETVTATTGTATLDLRNNIIVNECTPVGAGLAVAFRRSGASFTTDSTVSNNNVFYAGTPAGTPRWLHYDGGTNSVAAIPFPAAFGVRETNSKSFLPAFISTTDLHIQSCDATSVQLDGAGVSASLVATDIDGETRNTPNDIGADEFNAGSIAGNVTPNATVCSGTNSGTLTLNSYTGGIVRWESSTDSFATVITPIVNITNNQTYTNLTVKTWYRAVVDAGACGSANSLTASVSINPLPTAGIVSGGLPASLTANVCAGTSLQLYGSASASFANPWVSATTASVTISTTGLAVAVAVGTSDITYTNTNGCVTTLTVTVNPSSTVSGPTSVCVGASITLTGAGGLPDATTPWTSSNGAVASVTTAGVVTGLSAGTANITYSNSNGCQSAVYTITVNARPTITGSSNLCVGVSTTLTGTPPAAASTPWLSSNPSIISVNGGGFITGLTSGSSIITYTNLSGCVSDNFAINVSISPSVSLTNGGASIDTAYVCAGSTLQLFGTGTAASSTPWVCSNILFATVNASGLVTGVAEGTCNITFTNSNSCPKTITFIINPLPTKYTITGGGGYCIGGTGVNIGLSNSQAGVKYQLVLLPSTNIGLPVTGNTTPLNFGLQTTVGTYQVIATNLATNCVQATMLNTVAIAINSLPTISGNLNACLNSTTQLTGSATAAASPWGSLNTAVATVDNFGLVTPVTVGTSVITYTNTNGCTNNATVTVSPATVGGTLSSNASVCYGVNTGTLTLTGNLGNVVRWEYSLDLGTSWTPVVNTTNTLTYTNLILQRLYRVVVQNTAACSIGYSSTVTIAINALPIISTVTGGGAYCSGGIGVPVGLNGSQSGVRYQLVLGGSTNIGAPVNGSGAAFSFGNIITAGTYTVIATNLSTGCIANMTGNAIVSINSNPTASITQTGPINICAPATQTLNITTNVSPASAAVYQWFLNGTVIAGATASSYNISTIGSGIYAVLVTNSGNTCTSLKSHGIVVTINTSATGTAVSPALSSVCPGTGVTLTATNNTVTGNAVSLFEDFNSTTSWTISSTANSVISHWTAHNSPYSHAADSGTVTFNNFQTQDGGSFMSANADAGGPNDTTDTKLNSTVFSTANYTSATLTFEHALRTDIINDNFVEVDISSDGGTTWNLLKDYFGQTIGTATTTSNESIILPSGYLNQSNLKIRFYYASDWGYYWIIDNVKVSGVKEYPVSYAWSPSTGLNIASGEVVLATPASPTTYTATATTSAGCASLPISAVINFEPIPVITTQPTSPGSSVCQNAVAQLNVVATGNNLSYQWYSNTTSSTIGSTFIVGAINDNYTPPTTAVNTMYYYAVITGDCPSAPVTTAIVSVTVTTGGTWLGLNTNWNDAANWCGGVPNSSTNVTIPTRALYPIINVINPVCNNITIATGASISVIGGGKLGIGGSINNTGTFDAKIGTIEFVGTSAQTIPLGVFQNNNLRNLIINNSSVTLAGPLNLLGKLSFSGSSRVFNTNDNLTLKSSDTLTSNVADITNNNTTSNNLINGNVTVERYVSGWRAWRFLSMPTKHNFQTIKEAWQENQIANATAPAGFGLQITKDSTNWNTTGFDIQTTSGPSVKYYQNNSYKGITSTIAVPGFSNGKFEIGKPYMAFFRGDRTINSYIANQNTTPSILREKGQLYLGDFGPINVPINEFVAIGNPYASSINFSNINYTTIDGTYWLWDPKIGSLGAFQTFTTAGSCAPCYGSYGDPNIVGSVHPSIESGQGFFVHNSSTTTVGSITLKETSKIDGSHVVTRNASEFNQLRTNIYLVKNGERTLYDGVLNIFDGSSSNLVNVDDVMKLNNFGENLGLIRDGKLLSIENRVDLQVTDTIFYKLGQLKIATYQFEFTPQNIDQYQLEAILEDKYLNTSTPLSLSDTTRINFDITNNAMSYLSDRFRVVFKQLSPVPITFVDIKAERQNKDVLVTWKVENEINIITYVIEKSNDGRNFFQVGTKQSTGVSEYNWLDLQPYTGNNFYRIRSIGLLGENKYSRIVKITIESNPIFSVFPNPVKEDRIVNVNFTDVSKGIYKLRIINNSGQTLMRKTIEHSGGSNTYPIMLGKRVSHGQYNLEISGLNNLKTIFKLLF